MSRIVLVSSEFSPYAKTGGLADVSSALTRHLRRRGHEVRSFLPLYRRVAESGVGRRRDDSVGEVSLQCGDRSLSFSIQVCTEPEFDGSLFFVDCPELYDREGVYADDGDEALRFGVLSRAVLETCQRWNWSPHLVHCNDWHTALLPLYLKSGYAWDGLFAKTRSLLTLHNLGYQGNFSTDWLEALGLSGDRDKLHQEDLKAGHISFLKTGLLWADMLSTVSETYAREIRTEEFGFGMHTLLQARADRLVGIVNGVDGADWDPAHDPHLPAHFTRDHRGGKAQCRAALLEQMGLAPDPQGPVLGIVSRLTGQKGFDLLPKVLPRLCEQEDVRITVLGSGEESIETWFQWLRDQHPTKVGIYRGYHEPLAHRIEAGADLFLMPSRYEPCGLNQMYSLAYGTIPVVRRTGGLADTVRAFDSSTGEGTGFLFDQFDSEALAGALGQALGVWRDRDLWSRLVDNAMAEDWSWEKQVPKYEALYERMLSL